MHDTLSRMPTVIMADQISLESLYYSALYEELGTPLPLAIAHIAPFPRRGNMSLPRAHRLARMIYCLVDGKRDANAIAILLHADPNHVRQLLSYLALSGEVELYDCSGNHINLYLPLFERHFSALVLRYSTCLLDRFLFRLCRRNPQIQELFSQWSEEKRNDFFRIHFLDFLYSFCSNQFAFFSKIEHLGHFFEKNDLSFQAFFDFAAIFLEIAKEFSGEKWNQQLEESLRNILILSLDVFRYFSKK